MSEKNSMNRKAQLSLKNLFLSVTLLLAIPITGASQIINEDSSLVTFKISNLGINTVDGSIKGFEGTVRFDTVDISKSLFQVCIDPRTINTGISARDEALQEDDYFSAERYPRICYKSENITKTEEGFLSIGTLTLKGISREVSIHFFSEGNKLIGSFEINRSEYGVGPKSGFLVGKTAQVKIICVLEPRSP
jgi:polyisoprenoid-binding protein YceI